MGLWYFRSPFFVLFLLMNPIVINIEYNVLFN